MGNDLQQLQRAIDRLNGRMEPIESIRFRLLDIVPGSAVIAALVGVGALTFTQSQQLD